MYLYSNTCLKIFLNIFEYTYGVSWGRKTKPQSSFGVGLGRKKKSFLFVCLYRFGRPPWTALGENICFFLLYRFGRPPWTALAEQKH